MISWRDLHKVAVHERTLHGDEAERRRAISTLYYALFHRLCAEGAQHFDRGGDELRAKVQRAFNHGPMVNACKGLVAPQRLQPATARDHVAVIAAAFVDLQKSRETADYALSANVSDLEWIRLLQVAEAAHWRLDELQGTAELTTFLATLLLKHLWTRRG